MKRKLDCVEEEKSPRARKSKTTPQASSKSSLKGVQLEGRLEKFQLEDMPGSDILYMPNICTIEEANNWYAALEKLDTWYHPKLKVYGKEVSQSRSISAYVTDPDIVVRYSGHTVNLHLEYPPLLREIQDKVEELLGITFNHVMLNRYKNGQEYIGRHRDTKSNKVIASLSLGAVRTFILTPNNKTKSEYGNSAQIKHLPLGNGSLLVMQGDTQKNWKHEIPKEPLVKKGRISLTFRQLEA